MSTALSLGLAARDFVYRLLKIMHMLSSSNYSMVTVKYNNRKLKFYTHYEGLQVIDELLILNQYDLAYRLKPRVVVDVGAHIGVFSIPMALNILDLYGDGLVVAVEPVTINYRALVNNILINGVEKIVKPIKAAVSVNQSPIEIEWIGMKELAASITMTQLLEFIKSNGYNTIDLIKMDIEGAELDIITKDSEWLDHTKALVMELHSWVYDIDGITKIVKTLRRKGFNVKTIERKVDTRYALTKWIKMINLGPSQLLLTLWKSILSIHPKSIDIQYWIAYKALRS
jgi:FkbM family methyltransferase